MKVLLTGATGYLGSAVARALLAHNHKVAMLVRDETRARPLALAGAEPWRGDLLEPGPWVDRLGEVDAVVHSAGMVEAYGPPPEAFDRLNVDAALELLDHARRAGVERVVVTGSLFALGPSEDGRPRDEGALAADTHRLASANDYVRSKTRIARVLRDRQRAGDPVMQVFPTVLVGPGPRTRGNHLSRVLDDIRRGRQPGLIGDGQQVWNLVGVDDAARGHVLALERGSPGGTWILGGEDWTQERLVREAAARFGVKPPLRRLGRTFPRAVGSLSVLGARWFGIEPLLTPGEVDLLDAHWAFSSARAAEDLGYAPRPVGEVLDETTAWLRGEAWAS